MADLESIEKGLTEVDIVIQNRPSRFWHLNPNPTPNLPTLTSNLGLPRPVGEVVEGSYTPARYPKRYFTSLELKYSDKKFNPHTGQVQLFQFRSLIAAIITRTSLLLGLPSTTINRALHTFHHFYLYKASAEEFLPKEIAFACVFVASKEEDTRKKLNEVIEAGELTLSTHFPLLSQPRRSKPGQETTRERCLELESHILAIQCYQFGFTHPSHLLIYISRFINCPVEVSKFAFHIINDCYLFQICLQFTPQVITCGSLLLAARIKAPSSSFAKNSDWFTRFTCRPSDIKEFVTSMVENCDLTHQLLDDIQKSRGATHHHYQGVMSTCLHDITGSEILSDFHSTFTSPSFSSETNLAPRLDTSEMNKLFSLPSNQHPNGTRFVL